jgi:uncharacterized membrane protein
LGGTSQANALSFDGGAITGWAQVRRSPNIQDGFVTTPFRWTQTTGMQVLLNNGVQQPGAAYDISSDGAVVVGLAGLTTAQIFRWTQGGGYQFFNPITQPTGNFLPRVSGDGVTIITGTTFWTVGGGVRELTSVLSAAGCDFSGWSITGATGISYDGLTLAGEGIDPQGRRQAWIAAIPTPGTLLALGMSALLITRRRR